MEVDVLEMMPCFHRYVRIAPSPVEHQAAGKVLLEEGVLHLEVDRFLPVVVVNALHRVLEGEASPGGLVVGKDAVFQHRSQRPGEIEVVVGGVTGRGPKPGRPFR